MNEYEIKNCESREDAKPSVNKITNPNSKSETISNAQALNRANESSFIVVYPQFCSLKVDNLIACRDFSATELFKPFKTCGTI